MSGATRDARLIVSAPAKINLFLELLTKRPDGFHDLATVMTTLDLCDTLAFQFHSQPAPIRFRCAWAAGLQARDSTEQFWGDLPQRVTPPNASPSADTPNQIVSGSNVNLVVQALQCLRAAADIQAGADVWLTKRIPSQAGLGGGSSDAAAALVAGNVGWHLGWDTTRLLPLTSELGSDVAFFLSANFASSTIALCTGRGERREPLPRIPRLDVVLVRPSESLSTAEVYRHAQVPRKPRSVPSRFHRGTVRCAGDLGGALMNRLQPAAATISVTTAALADEFSQLSCVAHQLSGSGSTYFGVFNSRHDAIRTAQRLRARRVGHVVRARTGCPLFLRYVQPSSN